MQNIGIEIQNIVNQNVVFPIERRQSLNLNQKRKFISHYYKFTKIEIEYWLKTKKFFFTFSFSFFLELNIFTLLHTIL